jgi:hypothetical protein
MVLKVLEFGKQSRLYLQWEVRKVGLLDLSGTLGTVRQWRSPGPSPRTAY